MQFLKTTKILGMLILLLSLSKLFALAWSYYYYDAIGSGLEDLEALGISIGIGSTIGIILIALGRKSSGQLNSREALLLVSLSWFVGAGISALPFYIWAHLVDPLREMNLEFRSYVNCFFEAMSGMTTTGASILTDIERVPRGLLMWRSLYSWLGGLGIVVLFVAVLPILGVGNRRVFQAEATGVTKGGSAPKIQETARILWLIYMLITALEVVAIKIADPGIEWYTAITFAFTTCATCGFSVYNQSVGTLSPLVQWVLVFFMFICGINFALYYQLATRKMNHLFSDYEFKAYFFITMAACFLIFLNIYSANYNDMTGNFVEKNFEQILRDAAFQTVSIATTTGYSNADSNLWPLQSQLILLILMCIGGCGGSTAGGIKVVRIVSMIKMIAQEAEKVYRPSVIRPLALGQGTIDPSKKTTILIFVLVIFLTVVFGALILSILGGDQIDFSTAITASIATTNNIGPGFGAVGATQNYYWFNDASKIFMCILMAIGRLEIFAVLVLFTPRFWRDK